MQAHWLTADRLRNYPRMLLAMYLVLGVLWVASARQGVDPGGKPLGYDYIAFWTASALARTEGPTAPYEVERIVAAQQALVPGIKTIHPWQYPPTFLLLVLPLSLLPYLWSYLLFQGATLLAYLAVLRRIELPRAAWPAVLGFSGLLINFFHGQNGFLTGALFGAALLLLPRWPLCAGLLFGLLAIKPHLALLVPLALACGRQWRAFAAAAFSAGALSLLSVAVLGQDSLAAFLNKLPQVSAWVAADLLPLVKMPTVFASVRKLGLAVEWCYAVHGMVALGVGLAVAWTWRHCRDTDLRNALLACGSLLVSPYLFDYDLAWLALPMAWFARHALRTGWRRYEREVLVAAWLVPLVAAPLAQLTQVQVGAAVVMALFAIILRRVRSQSAISPG